jgi:hypothetical protein
MKVITYQGTVENGRIRLGPDVQLPERATVYVIVPESPAPEVGHIGSPRLAHPEQAADFEKVVVEEPRHAGV